MDIFIGIGEAFEGFPHVFMGGNMVLDIVQVEAEGFVDHRLRKLVGFLGVDEQIEFGGEPREEEMGHGGGMGRGHGWEEGWG